MKIFIFILCFILLVPGIVLADDCEECNNSTVSVNLKVVKPVTYHYGSCGCISCDLWNTRTLIDTGIYSGCTSLILSDIVAKVSGNSVLITWNTNKPVDCRLSYQSESGFNSGIKHTDILTNHSVQIDKLLCEKYGFQIFAIDDCNYRNIITDKYYFTSECEVAQASTPLTPTIQPTLPDLYEPEDNSRYNNSIMLIIAGVVAVFILIIILIVSLTNRKNAIAKQS